IVNQFVFEQTAIAAVFILRVEEDIAEPRELHLRAAGVLHARRDDIHEVVVLGRQPTRVAHGGVQQDLALAETGAVGAVEREAAVDAAEKLVGVESQDECESFGYRASTLATAESHTRVI